MSGDNFILIAYHTVEAEFAIALATELRNAGISLFIDRLDMDGEASWASAAESYLEKSAALLVVLSPDYVASPYGKRELAYAEAAGRPIITVLLRHVHAADWPTEISYRDYVDFSDWQDEAAYRRAIDEVIVRIRERLPVDVSAFVGPEHRHLNRLQARIEMHRTALEYARLSYHTLSADQESDPVRPQPGIEDTWGLNGPFALLDEQFEVVAALADLNEGLSRHPQCVLVGESGIGKTTTLHRLVQEAIQRCRLDPRGAPIPMMVDLALWTPEQDLETFLKSQWSLPTDVMALLADGQIALYMDGLDEMGSASAERVAQLRAWLQGEDGPARVVITCETSAYSADFRLGLPVISLQEMPDAVIRRIMQLYMGVQDADALLRQLLPDMPDDAEVFPPSRWDWALRNPLRLRLMMFAYEHSPAAELPANAAALMLHVLDILWQREQVLQNPDWIPMDDLMARLVALAYAMASDGSPAYVSMAAAHEHLMDDNLVGALCSARIFNRFGDRIAFQHQQFAAMLAARHLSAQSWHAHLEQPTFDPDGRRLARPWDTALSLMPGVVDNPDTIISEIAEADPYLAMVSIHHGAPVSDNARTAAIKRLLYFSVVENQAGLSAAAQLLDQVTGGEPLPILLDLMRDHDFNIRSAAMQILKWITSVASQALVDLLNQWDWNVSDEVAAELRRLGDEAVQFLLKLLDDEDWVRRRGAAWALGAIADRAAVPGLVATLKDADSLVRREAATALQHIPDAAAIPYLQAALRDQDWGVRKAAAEALGQLGQSAVPGLVRMVSDERDDVRRIAVGVLGRIGDAAALPALLRALNDDSVDVRSTAVKALGQIGDEEAVGRLASLLKDDSVPRWTDKTIRELAVAALQQIGSPAALAALQAHQDPPEAAADASTRGSSAAIAHSKLKAHSRTGGAAAAQSSSSSGLEDLKKALTSSDWEVRRDAVNRLAITDHPRASELLIGALRDEDNQVRQASVEALRNHDGQHIVDALLDTLHDHDFLVSDAAANALVTFGMSALPGLVEALNSEDASVRGAVVEALGKIGEDAAVPALARALYDTEIPRLEDHPIAHMAAQALQAIGTEAALAALAEADPMHEAEPTPEDDPTPEAETPDEVSMPADDQGQADQVLVLLSDIGSTDWTTSQQAIRSLNRMAPQLRDHRDERVMDRLVTLIQSPEPFIRLAAVEMLGWIRSRNSMAAMQTCLKDSAWTVRVGALRALAELEDPQIIPTLLEALTDKHELVREVAAETLGRMGSDAAIPGLIRALTDQHSFVRRAIIEALGEIGSPTVIPYLLEALKEQDQQVRWSAIEALGKMGDPSTVPELIRYLETPYEPPWSVLSEKRLDTVVVAALEKIGTDEALQAVANWRERNELS